jgi:hypothetical protein
MKTASNRTITLLLVIFVASLASGCATSHVLIGEPRPPISPDLVKIYSTPPDKYEEIAIVEASSKSSWAVTDQGKMNKAIERLKKEAAELGANGIVLQFTGTESGGAVGTGSATTTGNYTFGTGVAVPVNHKAASGLAIYVEEDQ